MWPLIVAVDVPACWRHVQAISSGTADGSGEARSVYSFNARHYKILFGNAVADGCVEILLPASVCMYSGG